MWDGWKAGRIAEVFVAGDRGRRHPTER
jgi:hypothetical protein